MRTRNLTAIALLVLASPLAAQQPPAAVQAVLARYCLECHQGEKARGELRLDALSTDFARHGAAWARIHDRATDRSMPPAAKAQPKAEELRTLTEWLGESLTTAEKGRIAREGRTTLRRLNRVEYANTLRDLLAVDLDLTQQLPEDGITNGFDTIGEGLHLSAAHLERYLEGADLALDAALNLPPPPKPTNMKVVPHSPETLQLSSEKTVPHAMLQGESLIVYRNTLGRELFAFRAPVAGIYRIRVPILGHQLDDKPYAVSIATGTYSGAILFQTIETRDLANGGQVVEFEKRLPRGGAVRLVGHGFARQLPAMDPKTYRGPGWGFGPIEVTGPLAKNWPPESRTRLLGNVDPAKATPADADALLAAFLPRAFRRSVAAAEVAAHGKIVRDRLAKGDRFEAAYRTALKAALCSPEFLFLREKPGPLDDAAIASRLSYFLWSSMPDEALIEAARTGKLRDAKGLREAAERLLNDPKSRRFTENFTGQWLSLRNIDFTTPDRKLYPEFDDILHDSMLRESHLTFEEMLRRNRPATEFVAADWAMLNGPMARFYGIAGVTGQNFRKVTLPPTSVRGGVLTQAAVLKVTANGTTTSPIVRGVWILERILGQPTPPPPANVPAVEPDTRGATQIRDQLARHRTQENCAGCHRRIDPPGFALEGFDAIGGQRERYRISPAPGQRALATQSVMVPLTNSAVLVPIGLPVATGDVLPDGRRFRDVIEFKQLLLTDRDQIARNLIEKLTAYATGAAVGRGDRDLVEAVLADVRPREYGFREMIHSLIQSPLFLRK